ncbi:MAG: hypothetical protein HFJ08_19360 [Lachnospiraceae bacterium]|jgi:hypothetical protein|nr:hypothetical protein [Lachnospiraceae bacterium]MCI9400620.1 hypothetical protein [Lachnospiraceae bacterium]
MRRRVQRKLAAKAAYGSRGEKGRRLFPCLIVKRDKIVKECDKKQEEQQKWKNSIYTL